MSTRDLDEMYDLEVWANCWAFATALMICRLQREQRQEQQQERQLKLQKTRRKKRVWVKDWLLRRPDFGHYDHLLTELHREDPKMYRNFLRITPDVFQEMVEKVSPLLKKQRTFMREPLDVGLKVATTLRFLATGDSYVSLQYNFRVNASTICKFIPEVCRAIYQVYKADVLCCPKSNEDWKAVAEAFSSRWNYHNCLGAVDGKHIAIKKPPKAGSLYYNYKGFHSIVLMAVVDAGYKFLYVDVGAEGGASDGGTWRGTALHDAVEEDRAGVPEPATLPGDHKPVPFHFVADDAFALRTWLMKPYSHRSQEHKEIIYSYRLSRARRVVENAFGILSQRFRCFLTTLPHQPERVIDMVLCSCVLHNLILIRFPLQQGVVDVDREDSATHEVLPGTWRQDITLTRLNPLMGHHGRADAKHMRDYLAEYYSSIGAVDWQDNLITTRARL